MLHGMDRLKEGRTLILMHTGADPDALAAAMLARHLVGDHDIGVKDGMIAVSVQMAEMLEVPVVVGPATSDYDHFLVVDSSSEGMVGLELPRDRTFVIDHHNDGGWEDVAGTLTVPRTSSVEVVLEILDENGIEITREEALASIAGISADTGRFRFGDHESFATVARLMQRYDIDLSEVFSLMESEHYYDPSRKIANVKGAQRMDFRRAGDVIIAFTRVSSFEGSVCRSLLMVGADIALTVSEQKKEARISGRAKPYLVRQGVNLGRAFQRAAEGTDANGGGHAGAAGIKTAPGADLDRLLKDSLEEIERELSDRNAE